MQRVTAVVVVLGALTACDGGGHRRGMAATTPVPAVVVADRPTPPTTIGAPPAAAFPLLPSPERAEQVSVGGAHACLLRHGGAVWCWGRNQWGELGDGAQCTGTRRRPPASSAGGRGRGAFLRTYARRRRLVLGRRRARAGR